MTDIYIGALSGTSANAIDTAAFYFDEPNNPLKFLAGHSEPLPYLFKEAILQLQTQSLSAYKLAQLDIQLGKLFAEAINTLIAKEKLDKSDIQAIGFHGQTMLHKPNAVPAVTIQIGNPHIVAAETRVMTVADFRQSDMALGGQGAPLTPAFHQAYLARAGEKIAILNIGGICNITFLSGKTQVTGFDCGPGNTLLDYWVKKHLGKPYDHHGNWASSAKSDSDFLESLKDNKFLTQKPLKSACTSDFSPTYLEQKIAEFPRLLNPATIQATLTEFTAACVADAINNHDQTVQDVYVCGGGAHNLFLLKCLKDRLTYTPKTTQTLGLMPEWVETATFAWLAKQKLENKPSNITAVTGAKKAIPLGVIYTAS